MSNGVEALDGFFWADEIAAFRAGRPKVDLSRELTRVVITTFGRDFASANCEYRRSRSGRLGRQSQTWARLPEGWRIVAAHVSWFQPA